MHAYVTATWIRYKYTDADINSTLKLFKFHCHRCELRIPTQISTGSIFSGMSMFKYTPITDQSKFESWKVSMNNILMDRTRTVSQRILESCEHSAESDKAAVVSLKSGDNFMRVKIVVEFFKLSQSMEHLTPILNGLVQTLMETNKYAIHLSGSASELYITPCWPCLNDIDLICQRTDLVAVFENGYNSPVNMHKIGGNIETLKILEVRERLVTLKFKRELMLLKYLKNKFRSHNREKGNENKSEGVSTLWAHCSSPPSAFMFLNSNKSALTLGVGDTQKSVFDHTQADSTVDFVESVQCLNWPKMIETWLERKRKYDWPTEETKKDVIRNGCHIISDPDMACPTVNWRLSFSKAEHVLVRTWSPEQQFVYHLLKFYFKTEIRSNRKMFYITSYKLKTLMLWNCEERPANWWTENSVISLVSSLLIDLESRISKYKLNNYLINHNMFDGISERYLEINPELHDIKALVLILRQESSEDQLNNWFETNYCLKWGSSRFAHWHESCATHYQVPTKMSLTCYKTLVYTRHW